VGCGFSSGNVGFSSGCGFSSGFKLRNYIEERWGCGFNSRPQNRLLCSCGVCVH
jgi:hypothetical protein